MASNVIRKPKLTQLYKSNEVFSCTKTLKFNVEDEVNDTRTSLFSLQNIRLNKFLLLIILSQRQPGSFSTQVIQVSS